MDSPANGNAALGPIAVRGNWNYFLQRKTSTMDLCKHYWTCLSCCRSWRSYFRLHNLVIELVCSSEKRSDGMIYWIRPGIHTIYVYIFVYIYILVVWMSGGASVNIAAWMSVNGVPLRSATMQRLRPGWFVIICCSNTGFTYCVYVCVLTDVRSRYDMTCEGNILQKLLQHTAS